MNLVIVLVVVAVVVVALAVSLFAARRRPVAVAASAPFDEDDGIVSEPVPIERAGASRPAAPPADAARAEAERAEAEPVDELLAAIDLGADPALTGALLAEPALEAEREPLLQGSGAELPVQPESTGQRAAQAPAEPPAARPDPAAAESAAAEVCWAKRFAPRSGALGDAARLGLIRDLGLVRAPWGVPLLVQAYDEEPDAAHRRAVLAALALYRHLDARAVFEHALRGGDDAERAIAGAALADLGITPSLPTS